MIRLTRSRTEQTIPAVFRGDKRIKQALTLLVAPGVQRTFREAYWKKAKKQLKAESGGKSAKCAYCEAPTSVVAHGDVEHFRPKAIYWWLAYCYDNYLYACQICNETFKSDNFPLTDENHRMTPPALGAAAGDAEIREYVRRLAPDPLKDAEGQPWTEFENACREEGCHLLNPYFDNPEEYFSWSANDKLKEVAVKPRGKSQEAKNYQKAAVDFYGLNRPELLTERWKTYHKLLLFRKTYEEPGISQSLRDEVEDELRSMMQDSAAFAGMCRHFVRRSWKLPL